jgi:hypothetical protein
MIHPMPVAVNLAITPLGLFQHPRKHRGTVLMYPSRLAEVALMQIEALAELPGLRNGVALFLPWERYQEAEQQHKQGIRWVRWQFVSPRNGHNCEYMDDIKEGKQKHWTAYDYACAVCSYSPRGAGDCLYWEQFDGPHGFKVYPAHMIARPSSYKATITAILGDGRTAGHAYSLRQLQEEIESSRFSDLFNVTLRALIAARSNPRQIPHMVGLLPRGHKYLKQSTKLGLPRDKWPVNFRPLFDSLSGKKGWGLRYWAGNVIAYENLPLAPEEALLLVKSPLILIGSGDELRATIKATGAKMIPTSWVIETIAENLWAEDSPVTQASVAGLAGLDRSTVSREWEGLQEATGAGVEVKAHGQKALSPPEIQVCTSDRIQDPLQNDTSMYPTVVSELHSCQIWGQDMAGVITPSVWEIKRRRKGAPRQRLPSWAIPWPAQTFDQESIGGKIRIDVLIAPKAHLARPVTVSGAKHPSVGGTK